MSYSCCSGSFSTQSRGDHLHYLPSSCGGSYSDNLVHSINLCPPRTCHRDSSVHGGHQRNFSQPIPCPTSHLVDGSYQRPGFHRSISQFYSPCQGINAGSQAFGSRSCHSLGYGPRSSYYLSFGSSAFRPHGFSSLGHGSGFGHSSYVPVRTCQTSCYRPIYYSSGCVCNGCRPRGIWSLNHGYGFCNSSCFPDRI